MFCDIVRYYTIFAVVFLGVKYVARLVSARRRLEAQVAEDDARPTVLRHVENLEDKPLDLNGVFRDMLRERNPHRLPRPRIIVNLSAVHNDLYLAQIWKIFSLTLFPLWSSTVIEGSEPMMKPPNNPVKQNGATS